MFVEKTWTYEERNVAGTLLREYRIHAMFSGTRCESVSVKMEDGSYAPAHMARSVVQSLDRAMYESRDPEHMYTHAARQLF